MEGNSSEADFMMDLNHSETEYFFPELPELETNLDSSSLTYYIPAGFFLIFGVFGNVLVILHFAFIKKCKKNFQLLIVILAFADFFATLSHLLGEWLTFLLEDVDIELPHKKWHSYPTQIAFSTLTASSYILVQLSYERYRAVAHPFNRSFTKMKIILTSFAIFIVCILCSIPFMISGHKIIDTVTKSFVYIGVINFGGRFLLPMILMTLFYFLTKRCLRRSANAIQNGVIKKRNDRVLRTIMWLILAFAFSMGIYESLFFLQNADSLIRKQFKVDKWENMYASNLILATRYLNNAINVVVYAGLMPDFRKFCLKLFTCWYCCARK